MNVISKELMKLSNEIIKLSSTGNSGINFELKTDGYFIFNITFDGKKIKFSKKPVEVPRVISFDAVGDEEGEENIKEKLFKITNAFFPKDEVFDYFGSLARNKEIEIGETYQIKLQLDKEPTKTLFNGGRRGYLTGGEDITFDDVPYTLTFEDDLIEKGKCEVQIVFENAIEKWYDNTFKMYR